MIVVALLPLLIVNLFFPGFAFVRRLRLSPLEKLCASVGLSMVLIYVLQFTFVITGFTRFPFWLQSLQADPSHPTTLTAALTMLASLLGTIASLVIAAFTWRDALRLLRRRQVRQALYALAAVSAWLFVLLALTRFFSGDNWAGDWLEHWERSGYFTGSLPDGYRFIQRYLLPSRPPLQHAVTAYFLQITGYEYRYCQMVFGAVGLISVPVCMLIARSLVRRPRFPWWLMAAILVTTPAIAQNLTWTWPKLGTGAFTVLGFHFYLRAWRKDSALHTAIAFLSLAAATLIHYSAGVYVMFVLLHYGALTLLRRRWAVREWLVTSALCLGLVSTWFIFTLRLYGAKETLGSNSTAIGYRLAPTVLDKVVHIATNLFNTLVPHPIREAAGQLFVSPPRRFVQFEFPEDVNIWSNIRTYFFGMYQMNVTGMFGCLAGFITYFLAVRVIVRSWHEHRPMERWFWPTMCVFTYTVGIAVVPPPIDRYGLAHACLFPLLLLGLTLLAAAYHLLPVWMRWLLVVSRIVDYAAGIWLHFVLQSVELHLIPPPPHSESLPSTDNPLHLEDRAVNNFLAKQLWHTRFFGDSFDSVMPLLRVICGLIGGLAIGALAWLARPLSRTGRPDRA